MDGRISFRLIPSSETAPIFAEWLRSAGINPDALGN
jgi:hypothetical protein